MTKIKKIHVHNVKAITDQELNLNGATAILMGGNNKGKSTLLKALKDRLLKQTPEHVIRHGETDGFYHMFFTDGSKIEWELTTKTKAGEKLTLISKDGNKTSVITEIINLFQPGSFDIDKFLNESPAAQRKSLEKLLGLDLSIIDQKYAAAVESRRYANRDVERIEINYKGKEVDLSLPTENSVSLADLQKDLLGVESHNRAYNLLVEEEERLLERRKALEEELKNINMKLVEMDEKLSAPEVQPITEHQVSRLQESLTNLKAENIKITDNNNLIQAIADLDKLRHLAHSKDIAVKDILNEKDNLIKNAQMPEGFAFTEEGLTYNGFELDRAAQSSSALYIAALKLASINVGNVRFLHFDASFLDKNSLKEVLDWAEGESLQLLLERADFEAGEISYQIIEEDWLNS